MIDHVSPRRGLQDQNSQPNNVLLPEMPGVPQAEVVQFLGKLISLNPSLLPDFSSKSSNQQNKLNQKLDIAEFKLQNCTIKHPISEVSVRSRPLLSTALDFYQPGSSTTSIQTRHPCNMTEQHDHQQQYPPRGPSVMDSECDSWSNIKINRSNTIIGRIGESYSSRAQSYNGMDISDACAILGNAPESVALKMIEYSKITHGAQQGPDTPSSSETTTPPADTISTPSTVPDSSDETFSTTTSRKEVLRLSKTSHYEEMTVAELLESEAQPKPLRSAVRVRKPVRQSSINEYFSSRLP